MLMEELQLLGADFKGALLQPGRATVSAARQVEELALEWCHSGL